MAHILKKEIRGAAGSLRELDLTDISTPIAEVRDYLTARYESRFTIHPRLFEETVASVLRDSGGWRVRVTNYRGDDGVDVFLDGMLGTIGVQVKRYKASIEVEQIRALAGALLYHGITRGIVVTTSSFQSGAEGVVNNYRQKRGVRIELMDAKRFFEALKIAQQHGGSSARRMDLSAINLQTVSRSATTDFW